MEKVPGQFSGKQRPSDVSGQLLHPLTASGSSWPLRPSISSGQLSSTFSFFGPIFSVSDCGKVNWTDATGHTGQDHGRSPLLLIPPLLFSSHWLLFCSFPSLENIVTPCLTITIKRPAHRSGPLPLAAALLSSLSEATLRSAARLPANLRPRDSSHAASPSEWLFLHRPVPC